MFPRTLRWQTFLLVAVLVAVVLATWAEIFRYLEQASRAQDVSRMVTSIVNISRTALINADPKNRSSLLIDLAALEGISIYPAEKGDRIRRLPDTRQFRLITQAIREHLGQSTHFAASWEGLEGFWVSFKIDESDRDEYWVKLPREKIERRYAFEWIFWTGATFLVALGVAFLVVSRISTPLQRLAKATQLISQQKTPAPIQEDGPQEIADLTHAFNQMSQALTQADIDRAMILAGVSHDLRTPLARLRLGIELTGAPESEIDAMVLDIEEMDRVIQQFLDFGRGTPQEPLKTLDLPSLIQDAIQPYLLRELPIQTVLPSKLSIAGRDALLRRALKNLIDNALRYAGDTEPIEVHCGKMPSGEVFMEVLDRGPGIPPDQVDRMRLPFTRLEDARTNANGTGLGLAIVERIVKAHNGVLDLLPREGGGLVARIRLHALPDQAA